jgi:hypothetical protein
MPDQWDIDRLRSWREMRRPPECKRGEPCWVDDPYRALGTNIGGTVKCHTCGATPTFNAASFSLWRRDRTEPPLRR